MLLDTEVGLGPGDIVLDGDPAPPRKEAQPPPPTFQPTLLWHDRPSQQLLSSCFSKVLVQDFTNKSSAVAEMDDRGHNRHGPKRGGLLCPFRGGSWVPV